MHSSRRCARNPQGRDTMSVDISSDSRVPGEALRVWRVNDLCLPWARAGQGRARQCGQANGPWQGAAHQKTRFTRPKDFRLDCLNHRIAYLLCGRLRHVLCSWTRCHREMPIREMSDTHGFPEPGGQPSPIES